MLAVLIAAVGRPLNGFGAFGLLLLNVIAGNQLKNYKDAEPRFFFWAASGWAFNLLYLGIEDLGAHKGFTQILTPRVTSMLVWGLNAANYAAFIEAARVQAPHIPLLANLRSWGKLAPLTVLLLGLMAEMNDDTKDVVHAVLIVVGTIAIGLLAMAYLHTFRQAALPFAPALKFSVVAPLAAYAMLQLAAFSAPPFKEQDAREVIPYLLLVGAVLKFVHVRGLLGFQQRIFSEYVRKSAIPDPAMIRRVGEQLAHELNTPALELRLRADAMSRAAGENADVAAARRAVEQILGATASFQDYLDEHRAEALQTRSRQSLNVACDQAIVSIKTTLRQGGTNVFRSHYEGGLHVNVVESELQQVIRNLLKNSVEAIRLANSAEHGIIAVTTRRLLQEGNHMLEVEIADNGPGIPAELRRAIFEDGFSTKKGRGRGHGLHIAAALSKKLDGELVLWDQPHATLGGAVFVVRLPEAEELDKNHHTADENELGLGSRGRSPRPA